MTLSFDIEILGKDMEKPMILQHAATLFENKKEYIDALKWKESWSFYGDIREKTILILSADERKSANTI